jgi:hypothetical protein
VQLDIAPDADAMFRMEPPAYLLHWWDTMGWVTHQVNMTALTGAYPGLGEAFVVDRQGRLLARGWMST